MGRIVYLDDDPTEVTDQLTDDQNVSLDSFNPLVPGDFARAFERAIKADLWVFDYYFGVQDNTDETLGDENGLSAFEKWRRRLKEDRPPTALVSNALDKLLGSRVPTARSHIHARQIGVEWVGSKTDVSSLLALYEASNRIRVSLADLDSSDGNEGGMAEMLCAHVLGTAPKAPWYKSAERQVDRARPPNLSITSNERGRTRLITAWLLHRILPYPSFLLTRSHAAIRMGITPDSFDRLVSGPAALPLSQELRATEYAGPLGKFSGRRWWRAGVDHVAWSKSQATGGYESALAAAAAPIELEFLPQPNPVIVSDADLVETEEIRDASECIRAQDDDFPADVPPAWVPLEIAKEDAILGAQVVFEDQARLAIAREDDNRSK
jgi:hypothetical protein